MKKQPRMTKNRIEVTVTRSYVTNESAGRGDFDRHEEINRWVFTSITEAAAQLAYEIYDLGLYVDMDITGIYTDSYTDCRTGESRTDYIATRFGANFDRDDATSELTALVKHYLITKHDYSDERACRAVGITVSTRPAVNDNFSYPDQRPRLYLVK